MTPLSIVSALFHQHEVDADPDILKAWPTAYIMDNHGNVFTHKKLSAGGYATLLSKTLPERLKGLAPTFSEQVSHLPGGRIPLNMFSQVCSFFKKVMHDKGYSKASDTATSYRGSNEAMAHILWNTLTSQYEIGIPTQKVASASVDFKYDDVEEHHVIVVDVHSHNNMSAFWSPRDNKEDEKGVWFSGVVGTIDKGPTTNWRFSCNGEFRAFDFSTIFDGDFKDVAFDLEVPQTWMDKVSDYVAPSYSTNYRGSTGVGSGTYHRDTQQRNGWMSDYPDIDWKQWGFDDTEFGVRTTANKSQYNADITFIELRTALEDVFRELNSLGTAAAASGIYRPRIVLPRATLGQALLTMLESIPDADVEVLMMAMVKAMANTRRSAYVRKQIRVGIRKLDNELCKPFSHLRAASD